MSFERVLSFSKAFKAYLNSLSCPIAIVPPALSELFQRPYSSKHFRDAFSRLGFAEVLFIADHLPAVMEDLGAKARHCSRRHSFFTACPTVDKLLDQHQNAHDRLRLRVEPPAARAVRFARNSHPEGVLFFISPCSARGRVLDVDHEVPLHTIFEALSDALGSISLPDAPALDIQASHPFSSVGGKAKIEADYAIIDDVSDIHAYLKNASEMESSVSDGNNKKMPIIRDFIGCRHGCAFGDWSPVRKVL